MGDSQLILDLLFLHIRGSCSLTVFVNLIRIYTWEVSKKKLLFTLTRPAESNSDESEESSDEASDSSDDEPVFSDESKQKDPFSEDDKVDKETVDSMEIEGISSYGSRLMLLLMEQ